MTMGNRQLLWLQGNVLTDDAVKVLNLLHPESPESTFAVVVSHDCDLTASTDKEPVIEVIVGRRIENLGADSYGKTARRLHLEYQSDTGVVVLELLATQKKTVNKSDLLTSAPRIDLQLDGKNLRILQRWLAARYARAAFPESFEKRLREAKLLKKIEKILDEEGDHIRALLFDLDEGSNVERKSSDDLYQLGIVVLYDGYKDEPTAFKAAERVVKALKDVFEKAFNTTGCWQNIELKYCDPTADSAMTVANSELLKQWRLEHLSLQDELSAPMITA